MAVAVNYASVFAKRCTHATVKFPKLFGAVSSGAIAMAGDVAVQKIEAGKENKGINWLRACNMGFYRSVIFSPQYLVFLNVAERRMKTMLSKLLMDQLVVGPIAIAQFYVALTLLEGGTIRQGIDKLTNCGKETIINGWCLWIPIQAITFGVVPLAYRIHFVSAITVGWNGYLSYTNNMNKHCACESELDIQLD